MNDEEIKAKTDEMVRLCLGKRKIKDEDERILKFKEELPDFIREFDDTSMSMIENLLYCFDYFLHANVNKRLAELYAKINTVYDLDPNLTAYSISKELRHIVLLIRRQQTEDKDYAANNQYGICKS